MLKALRNTRGREDVIGLMQKELDGLAGSAVEVAGIFDEVRPVNLPPCGDRIWNLKRLIGNLSGAGRQDDMLPKRLLTPTAEGGAAGSVPDMDLMLAEFYALREIGPDGRPSRSRLERLGLKEA